jgi:cation diffusion facilitator CzcD-associated flavoprotein CzcO
VDPREVHRLRRIHPGYLHETVAEHDLASHVRLSRQVRRADWSSETHSWTLEVDAPARVETWTCSFLYLAAGYYDYDRGNMPDSPGLEQFGGVVIHPQEWPEGVDCAGQRVAVIGSGATAITLAKR